MSNHSWSILLNEPDGRVDKVEQTEVGQWYLEKRGGGIELEGVYKKCIHCISDGFFKQDVSSRRSKQYHYFHCESEALFLRSWVLGPVLVLRVFHATLIRTKKSGFQQGGSISFRLRPAMHSRGSKTYARPRIEDRHRKGSRNLKLPCSSLQLYTAFMFKTPTYIARFHI